MQPEALLDHAAFVRELAGSLTFGGEDPEDVVQQTWLRAIEHPPAAGPGLKGWLATVLRNVLRQSRRGRGRRMVREALAAKPPAIPTPEEIREREATRREVVEAVLGLDEPYRTAVILRYYEDLPPRRIAERLGDPVETVKTRLVRARRMLRGRLDERHGGGGKRWGFAVALLALLPGDGRPAPAPRALPVAGIAAVLVVAGAILVTALSLVGSPGAEPPPKTARSTADPNLAGGEGPAAGEEPSPETGGEEKAGASPDGGDREREAAGAGGKPPDVATVEGRVLDADTGDPIPWMDVALSIRTEGFPKRHTITDGEGRYRFEGLPCGVPVIPFTPMCSRAAILRDAETGKERVLVKGETLTRDFRARPARGVVARVRLVLPEGVEPPTELKVTHEAGDPSGQHRAQYMSPRAVSGDPPAVTIFLPLGRSLVGFEAPGLRGDLPPRDVAAEGPPLDLSVTLVRRHGVRMRLVDGNGERLLRDGVKVTVLIHRETRNGETVNWSTDSLGVLVTDAGGEVDLTETLPAPNPRVLVGTSFGFSLEADGVFSGFMVPNHRISVTELARRMEEAASHPVVIEIPALPWFPVSLVVRDVKGRPVEGVRVAGRPAECFADAEHLSDAEGRVTLRVTSVPPLRPGPPPRLHVLAVSPWIGKLDIGGLLRGPPSGEATQVLVVRTSTKVALKLVSEEGEPLAATKVEVNREEFETDAAGAVSFELPENMPRIRVIVPGHVPALLETETLEGEVEVRLERGRELRVVPVFPDGKVAYVPLAVFEPDRERRYWCTGYEQGTGAQTFLVPRRVVKVTVSTPKWRGEALAGPEAKEVLLELEAR